jgi:NADH-quinone oxidoreductase subunit L
VFSMTMLVTASNFVVLYAFWEAVGLCSYLLIGFWFQKPVAAAAGKKAFLVTRVGDCGFALGIFLIWITFGSLDFDQVFWHHGLMAVHWSKGGSATDPTVLTAICLLLLLGACGKSAQFPLHVWLPDAMEGPTPVSALIHAATMVTAGVYMVARCTPLFAASPTAQQTVAVIGGLTAIMAALIALTQNDLKRILAYSTISQLGYMFLALGAGTLLGVTSGMFHLVTHAFFKALLFLGAGSVMHAMGNVIDVRRFGGLRRLLPITHATFLVGCLALAGVWPFAGFWSKDAILTAIHEQAGQINLYGLLYFAAMATALLTAFYTFRAFFLTFYGPERVPEEAGHHAHESPRWMTAPLIVLALGSIVVGAGLEWTGSFARFLGQMPSLAVLQDNAAHPGGHLAVAAWSTAMALSGIALAWFLYIAAPRAADALARAMKTVGLYQLSYNKFYFDEIYAVLIVWPLVGVSHLFAWIDRVFVDGLVNLCGQVPVFVGAVVRPLQNGMIQVYAAAMLLGLLALLGALLL